jgi:putative transcriptional regulator
MGLLKKVPYSRCNLSKLIEDMLETAKDLRMNPVTIKEIEILNLAEITMLDPSEIKKTRL